MKMNSAATALMNNPVPAGIQRQYEGLRVPRMRLCP